ncbi:MAG: S24 family peptidase [Gemmatimonadaceae bacterium]|nr:S24 family peptidase [Gemmatimonadaceae bacterium]
MSNALTPTEDKVYQYLIEFLAANSYQPSIREIGRQFDIKSTKTVSDILGNLARKGYIQRNQARSRGLRILGAHPSGGTRAIPFYSRLAALGAPVSPELRTDSIIIDRRLAPSDNAFFVRVADDAMSARGIRRDDTVLVNPDFAALDGDVVAARSGHDAVIRLIEQRGNTTVLVATSDDVAPMSVPPGDDQVVLGVVSGVFRGALQAEDTIDPDTEVAA